MSLEEMNAKIKELREYKRMADDLAGMIESIQDEIKATMTAQETDTLTGPDWKVTWKNVNTTRFDSKSFKADHADLYAAYSRKATQTRFVLA